MVGPLHIFPPDSYHDVEATIHRDCSRTGAAGQDFARSSWEAQPASVAGSAASPQYSFSSTPALAGHVASRLPQPPRTQRSGRHHPPGLVCPKFCQLKTAVLCHSLSHSCAISTKVWTPSHGAQWAFSGRPGGAAPCVCLLIFSGTVFVTEHALFIPNPLFDDFYICGNSGIYQHYI